MLITMAVRIEQMNSSIRQNRDLLPRAAVGAILGVLFLHPLMTVVFYAEFNDLLASPADSVWMFVETRLRSAAWLELIPMSVAFALIGIAFGLLFGRYANALKSSQDRVQWLEHELNLSLPSLVALGENERLELKSTLRWDLKERCTNKTLENVIAKSIAGLMNHRGGSLIIGVADNGDVIGIGADCQTLRHKNIDGFERALMDVVRKSLGAHACTLIHCQFPYLGDEQVCRLIIEPSVVPIFIQHGGTARYVVRTGNSTRELDAREAHAHVEQRNAEARR